MNSGDNLQEVPMDSSLNTQSALHEGDALYYQGNYKKAFFAYNKALITIGPSQESISPELILIHQKLGQTYLKEANYREAHESLNHALELKESLKDNDVVGILRIKLITGRVLMAESKLSEASKVFEEALSTLLEFFPDQYKDIITCYNGLAETREEELEFQEALDHLNNAEKIALTMSDNEADSPELATTYYLLGRVYKAMRKREDSWSYTEKSLRMRERLYGRDHPDIAFCYNTQGHIYKHDNKYNDALIMYGMALEIRVKFLGEIHPQVAGCYDNIGTIHRHLRNYDKALENHNKALIILVAGQLSKHPDAAITYQNIAYVKYKQRRYLEAATYYEKAFRVLTGTFGENHQCIAALYQSFASVSRKLKQFDRAEEYLQKSLSLKLAHHGPKSLEVSDSYNELGTLYRNKRELPKSLRCFMSALKIRLHSFKVPDEEGHCYFNLSLLLEKGKNDAESEKCIRKSYVISKKIYTPNDQTRIDDAREIKYAEKRRYLLDCNNDMNI